MRKIVIYKEVEGVKEILRSIQPSLNWQGYARNGSINDSEARNLARALEPSFTGYFLA
jgi:hypothetical protein